MIPFSLLWGGFAVYWESSVVRTHAPPFMEWWGIPFVCIAAYITVGRFFYDAWRRTRTAYGLTTERVLISSGGLSPRLLSMDLASLPAVSLDERPDGSGTITFGPVPALADPMFRTRGTVPSPSFEAIAGAKTVYESIRTARDAVRSASAG